LHIKDIRYRGSALRPVAQRAATYLFKKSSKKMINFSLKEITKHSMQKIYKYKASILASGIINLKLQFKNKKRNGGSIFDTGDIVLLYDINEQKYLSNSDNRDYGQYMNVNERIVLGKSYKLVDKNHIDKNALWKIHKDVYNNKYTIELLFPGIDSKYRFLSHKDLSTYQYFLDTNTFIFTVETYFISDVARYLRITENDEITDETRFCPYLDKLSTIQVQHARLEDFLPTISELRKRETIDRSISRRKQSLVEVLSTLKK
jgi:hypothetical protein